MIVLTSEASRLLVSGQVLNRLKINDDQQNFSSSCNLTSNDHVQETRTWTLPQSCSVPRKYLSDCSLYPTHSALTHNNHASRCSVVSLVGHRNNTQTIRNETSNRSEGGISGVCSTEGHCNAASDRCTQPAGATNPKTRGWYRYTDGAWGQECNNAHSTR